MVRQKPALQVENVTVRYGNTLALDRVTFEVQEGEVFALLGTNGAGKTSFISTAVTLQKPTTGQIRIFGRDTVKDKRYINSVVGWVPQEIVNHGFFSVLEVLKHHGGLYGLTSNISSITELLKRFDLWQVRDRKVKQLSVGMKKRLAVVKALLHRPRLIFLDEPTAGVDVIQRSRIWDFLNELNKTGMTIILTTHDLREAEVLSSMVGILNEGRICHVGGTLDLVQSMTSRHVQIFADKIPSGTKSPYLRGIRKNSVTYEIPRSLKLGEILVDFSDSVKSIRDIKTNDGSLEDAFRKLLVLEGPKDE